MRIAMKTRIAFLSVAAAVPLMLAAANAGAAPEADPPVVSSAAGAGPERWVIRAETSLVDMRDNWLGFPEPEVGLTVARDLLPVLAIELTGSGREPDSSTRRSWSTLAALRAVVVANATGHHALTVAGGPMLEIGNVYHGTLPFAHTELAYVYRSSFGLTALAGGGVNFALADSSYVTPPADPCPQGDSPTFCIDLGPDAHEIHTGDRAVHLRFAVGWQF